MRRAIVLSAFGLLLLLGLFKFPVPIYRDHTFLHFPVWEVAAKSEGFFFPLSNPYLNHGAPMASDPNHLLLYPTAWLLKLLTAQQAYSIHFFGHALLSFWLMAFLLMGRLDRSKALILAAFWVLSGPFLSAAASLNLFTAFCWVPGILLAAQRASVPGQVLTLSMAALAGEPVIGMGAASLALVYSPNRKRTLVSLGLTALLFLPFFLFLREAFAYSTRMMGGQTWRTALNASLNPARLPEALLPFLFGVPGTRAGWAAFLNPKDFLLPSLGMLWLAFALFEGRRRDWIVLGSLLFLGLGSFNPIVALLYKGIPQLAWLRFPEKFILLAAFLVCWRVVDRSLHYRWLDWSSIVGIQALFYSPLCGVLCLFSWATLSLWGMNKIRWALLPSLAFGLTMAFYSVPLSSDLDSLQGPEQTLLEQLQNKRVFDKRDLYKIPEETRERYRTERRTHGMLIEPPLKEPYYLRRRLLLVPTGMGRGIGYAFAENTSGSGLIYYDMVRESIPKRALDILYIYGVDYELPRFGQAPKPIYINQLPPIPPWELLCSSNIQEAISLLTDRSKEVGVFSIVISGNCDPGESVRTWILKGDKAEIDDFGMRVVAQCMRTYSPLQSISVDGRASPPSIAYGSLSALIMPEGKHVVSISEPYARSLLTFLFLFYAMLLSVAIYCMIKSRKRQEGIPRE